MSISFGDRERLAAQSLLALAIDEDLAHVGDLTSQTVIPVDSRGRVQIVSRKRGVLSGLPIVSMVYAAIGGNLQNGQDTDGSEIVITPQCQDGDILEPGTIIATLTGSVRTLLTGERTALNFLTLLSGTATLTLQFVEAVKGTHAKILDTRKTLPGYRALQKYAVRCGGGMNHRQGLYDAVMIKDNHLAAWVRDPSHSIADAVRSAREAVPEETMVIVEVDTLDQLRLVLPACPDVVLLDNMPTSQLIEAVSIRNRVARSVALEASGGVNLKTIREIAETGVDRISIGALTHSAPALDLGFDWPVASR
ncbi:MAG: carboxylating nicotinate-nucleotide diphosphorylase [Planctomycetaceae bacterium]